MSPSGPPTTEIAAGETLHRIHAVTNGARFYGRKDATWRWTTRRANTASSILVSRKLDLSPKHCCAGPRSVRWSGAKSTSGGLHAFVLFVGYGSPTSTVPALAGSESPSHKSPPIMTE